MIDMLVLRHGVTAWNQEKRLQGQTDIPLSEEGITALQVYSVPPEWRKRTWYCSPLLRARQTADCLGLSYGIEPALQEASWGDWEGYSRAQLIQQYGEQAFTAMEQKGLDLLPPGGESPRQLQARLNAWIKDLAAKYKADLEIGMVCHRGVIRALLSLATHWDMLGKPPHKLHYAPSHAQRFSWERGKWSFVETNLPLEQKF